MKGRVLTWGDLASDPNGSRPKRSEKSAEAVVAAGGCEGPNEEESETNVRLRGKRPQMSRQLELPLENRGETPRATRSAEEPTAAHENERSGASRLMDLVCERENLQAALKVAPDLRSYLLGWKNYFRLADNAPGLQRSRRMDQAPTARATSQALETWNDDLP